MVRSTKLHMKKNSLAITVIIPAYNTGAFIGECLDSVYAQTLLPEEVIVVDDGSTDETAKVVQSYQEKHGNLLLISQANSGQGLARNKALDVAKGEFILFLDSDDTIEATLFEAFSKVEVQKPDIYHFNWRKFTSSTLTERTYHVIDDDNVAKNEILHGAQCDQMLTITNYFSANNIFRRQFLVVHDIIYGNGTLYEDNVFMVRAITRAELVINNTQALYNYRFHSSQSTKTKNESNLHFNSYTDAIVSMRDASASRTDYSDFYLLRYMTSKLLVYTELRIPSQYHAATMKHFIEVAKHMTIVFDSAYPSRFLQLCFRLKIFEHNRYRALLFLVRMKIAYGKLRSYRSR